MKMITLWKMTDEGLEHLKDAKDVLVQCTDLVTQFGGKIEAIYATGGRYHFVSVTEFPTNEDWFKTRVKLLETGYFELESLEAFDMDFFLSAV